MNLQQPPTPQPHSEPCGVTYSMDDFERDAMWLAQILPGHPQDSESEVCPTCCYNRITAAYRALSEENERLRADNCCYDCEKCEHKIPPDDCQVLVINAQRKDRLDAAERVVEAAQKYRANHTLCNGLKCAYAKRLIEALADYDRIRVDAK